MRTKLMVWIVVVLLYVLSIIPAVYNSRAYDSLWVTNNNDADNFSLPSDISYNSEIDGTKTNVIDVEVCYFSPIGTMERSTHKIPLDRLVELKERISCETDPEKIISLLKEYGILKGDATVEHLQNSLKGTCPHFNTLDTPVRGNAINKNNTFVNINCAVIGTGAITFSIPLLIPLLGIFAPIISFVSVLGTILTDGSLGGWYVYGTIYGIILGFVGLWINAMTLFHLIIGAALFVVAGY